MKRMFAHGLLQIMEHIKDHIVIQKCDPLSNALQRVKYTKTLEHFITGDQKLFGRQELTNLQVEAWQEHLLNQ